MSLTDDDLKKIKKVVDTGHELTRSFVDQRIAELRGEMATKADLAAMEQRLMGKIKEVRDLHTEDHVALAEEVAPLKKLPARLRVLEKIR